MIHSIFDLEKQTHNFKSSNYTNKPVIVFVYMNGCPYCEMMKPAWNSFKEANTISTIDVNHELLNSLISKDSSIFKPANSFPTIYSNSNLTYEGDRSTNSFLEFSKIVKQKKLEKQKTKTDDKKPKKSEENKPKSYKKKKDDNKPKSDKEKKDDDKAKSPKKDKKAKSPKKDKKPKSDKK